MTPQEKQMVESLTATLHEAEAALKRTRAALRGVAIIHWLKPIEAKVKRGKCEICGGKWPGAKPEKHNSTTIAGVTGSCPAEEP